MATVTDFFCGAGGSSTGYVEAGHDVILAANHWQLAVDSHQENHPNTRHLVANINQLDMRSLPPTDILHGSVICTEISPAGGRKRRPTQGQQMIGEAFPEVAEELGALPREAFDHTRATALDVIRATEVHRYAAVVVENVVEFATDWELFDWWRSGMHLLGYTSQIVSASSAHLGDHQANLPAPQWRDRIYVVFARRGVLMPDLSPTPLAWCGRCRADGPAVQAWRGKARVGKFRQQYDFRCAGCAHVVEPYIRPAADVIDWSNLGTRIGDRARPLADKTMAKIRKGLELYSGEPSLITVNHGGHDPRALPVARAPLPTRTVKVGEGVLTPPGAFIAELRGGGSSTRPVTHPLATVAASGNHHGLVIPYRRGTLPVTTGAPLPTVSTRDSAGLLGEVAVDVEDCRFRMISPREQLSAQRFPADYVVLGNGAERTMQAGNAVSVNATAWLGARIGAVLDGAVAA